MQKIETNQLKVAEFTQEFEYNWEVPENLSALTMQILNIHKKNGDLSWVGDMLTELENEE